VDEENAFAGAPILIEQQCAIAGLNVRLVAGLAAKAVATVARALSGSIPEAAIAPAKELSASLRFIKLLRLAGTNR
jgi:hypothetical protein